MDASDKVPDLIKNHTYANFQLLKKDWDQLEVIYKVLQVHTR